ncbi:HEAT repeat domain-containing protein [Actinomycetes bacterium NPDC127524]
MLPFLSDRRYQVRHSAIKALRKCNGLKIEEALIQVLLHPIDTDDLICANEVLSEIGTANAIPFLMNLLDHQKDDVKGSALYALSVIGGNELLPVFIKALTEGTVGLKSSATSAIHRHGDETAINAVIARVRQGASDLTGIFLEVISTSHLIYHVEDS